MAIPNIFKLEKLKISAFANPARTVKTSPPNEIEAMFNPTSLKQSYGINWDQDQGINSSGVQVNYSYSRPASLEIDLILDSTGVHDYFSNRKLSSAFGLPSGSVGKLVKQFLDVTYRYDGEIHEPHYLRIAWGDWNFSCRLQNVDVVYSAFGRGGKPLRAELKSTFIADEDAERLAKKENKSSPDLTHIRVVRRGDTLPLLSREIYASASHYLSVARFNDLDQIRDLPPGLELSFPPLDQLPPQPSPDRGE